MDDQALLNILNLITAATLFGMVVLLCIEIIFEKQKLITKEGRRNLKLKYSSILFGIVSLMTFLGSWIVSNRISEKDKRNIEILKLEVDTTKVRLYAEISKNEKERSQANLRADSLRKITKEIETQNKILEIELEKSKFNISQVALNSANKKRITKNDYDIQFKNQHQVDSYNYLFDVFIKSRNTEFEIITYQCVIDFDWKSLFQNEGDVSFNLVEGTSSFANIPNIVGINSFDKIPKLTFAPSKIGSDLITTDERKIGTFRINNSRPFKVNNLNLTLDTTDNTGTLLIPSFYKITNQISLNNIGLPNNFKISNNEEIAVKIKTFLEGPYNNNAMLTTLRDSGFIPLSQPYNTPPWNYSGLEKVKEIPIDVVDWILIELRKNIKYIICSCNKGCFP